jgi:hypothetical protein
MNGPEPAPWLPSAPPDLPRLAMVAADAAGVLELRAWPEWRRGGVGFGDLPPFLPWTGRVDGQWQLVLVQPRELGALVPGARTAPLRSGWLEGLDLAALARPLAILPDFPGGAGVQVVSVAGSGRARVRSHGPAAPELVRAVLARLTGREDWEVSTLER